MRFYLDEDLSATIAQILRTLGIDAISSHECGRDHLGDAEQLRLAAADGRCLVTGNRDDFVALTVTFFEQGAPHAGVLILTSSFPKNRYAAIARAIAAYSASNSDGMQPYSYDYLHP